QAVEVILPLPAGGDDAAVPEQGEMVAHGGLALAKMIAERSHVLLALGENENDLKARRGADVLQKDGGPPRLMEALLGVPDGFALCRRPLSRHGLQTGFGCGHPIESPRCVNLVATG